MSALPASMRFFPERRWTSRECGTLESKFEFCYCLPDLQCISKMNDMFAVRLFCIENVLVLMTEQHPNCCAFYYLLPFLLWYAAISIANLDPQVRLDLLSMGFHIFRDWLRLARPAHNPCEIHKYLAGSFSVKSTT
jgi:hypothetical protein